MEADLRMALGRRNPAVDVLHHSQIGAKSHTSLIYQVALAQFHIQVSRSGKGAGSRYYHDGELHEYR